MNTLYLYELQIDYDRRDNNRLVIFNYSMSSNVMCSSRPPWHDIYKKKCQTISLFMTGDDWIERYQFFICIFN